jgi:cysteinyl-tRNA synthetase
MHLNTSNGKMSKSKGEFLTVSLLEEKGYNPLAYRFFCLQSHYRKSQEFSYEALSNAEAAFNKLLARVGALKEDGEVDETVFAEYTKKFNEVLGNDLNTSLAVTSVYDALKADTNDATKLAILNDFDKVFSLDLVNEAKKYNEKQTSAPENEEDAEIDALVAQRTQARKDKNWAEADRIRDELNARGIVLTDTPEGVKWSRK